MLHLECKRLSQALGVVSELLEVLVASVGNHPLTVATLYKAWPIVIIEAAISKGTFSGIGDGCPFINQEITGSKVAADRVIDPVVTADLFISYSLYSYGE